MRFYVKLVVLCCMYLMIAACQNVKKETTGITVTTAFPVFPDSTSRVVLSHIARKGLGSTVEINDFGEKLALMRKASKTGIVSGYEELKVSIKALKSIKQKKELNIPEIKSRWLLLDNSLAKLAEQVKYQETTEESLRESVAEVFYAFNAFKRKMNSAYEKIAQNEREQKGFEFEEEKEFINGEENFVNGDLLKAISSPYKKGRKGFKEKEFIKGKHSINADSLKAISSPYKKGQKRVKEKEFIKGKRSINADSLKVIPLLHKKGQKRVKEKEFIKGKRSINADSLKAIPLLHKKE